MQAENRQEPSAKLWIVGYILNWDAENSTFPILSFKVTLNPFNWIPHHPRLAFQRGK